MRCLALLSLVFFSLMSFPSPAGADNRTADFNKAYLAYQAAIAAEDRTLARAEAQKAYELGRDLFGPDHKSTAILALNYGRLLEDDEAEKMLHEALRLHENVYGNDAMELIDPLMDVAAEHTKFGRLGNAKRYYGRALDIAESRKGENDPIVGILNLEIGQVALADAQSQEAIKYFKRAEEIFATIEGDEAELRLAQTRFWTGKYRLAAHSEKTATDLFLASLETFERLLPDAPITLTTHAFLVEAYERRGLRDAATKHCRAIGQAKPINPDQDYKPIYRKPPDFPPQAGEGSVVVSLTVDEDGFVRDQTVVENKGSVRLVRAALEATESFRYVPRYENGRAVATTDVKYRFNFKYAD